MNTTTIDDTLTNTIQALNQKLQRLPTRSPTLGKAALLLVHLAGCLLMTSPILMLLTASGGALYLFYNIQGPLDWFLLEVQVALALLGAYLSVQLLMLRPHPPRGVRVGEQGAPELFVMLERRLSHFKMGPIRRVVMTTEPELRVVASPVLPLPLFHRYSLCIGAPIMFFLSRAQFRLGLAGAVAAAAEEQSRLNGWLRQACHDWPLILDELENNDHLLSRLFTAPLRFIGEAANILGSPLCTDWRVPQGRWLLQHSDERTATDYLASQVVAAAFLERQYWPMILKAAERCPTPVVRAFSHLPLLLQKTLNRQVADRWLVQAQTASDWHQTGVRDLLAELKLEHLLWSGLPTPNAFCVMFKSTGVLKELDQLWQEDIELEWQRRHEHFQNDRSRFEQLQRRAAAGDLRGESALRYIKLVSRFQAEGEATACYRGVYATNQDDAKVCFAAGLALLLAGVVEDGSQALLRAAELEPAVAQRVRALIAEHRKRWMTEEADQINPDVRDICA
jgi:hypothetical protein